MIGLTIVTDKVEIHYVGTLEGGDRHGEQFDTSRKPGYAVLSLSPAQHGSLIDALLDSGKPFKTQIGIGKVIKGWDEGAYERFFDLRSELISQINPIFF
jgi:FKBP-type peptidyl-prolyl cis-trans isomerase